MEFNHEQFIPQTNSMKDLQKMFLANEKSLSTVFVN